MLYGKQYGSWSAGFFRSQLMIYTVYKRVYIWFNTVLDDKLFKHRKIYANLFYRTCE